jgi:hypothetical protein
MFQSIGVVGIAAGVGYFVLQRHATPHPVGAIEFDTIVQKQLVDLSDAVERSLAHNALLAKAIVQQSEREGREPSSVISRLADVPIEHLDRTLTGDSDELAQELDAIEAKQLSANAYVLQTRRAAEILQASVVILGTLQSGLGGILVESLK